MMRLFTRRPDIRTVAATLEQHTIGPALQTGLADFLSTAEERELFHFNPRYLGERLALAERPTLKLLLAALYEGIVKLHWDVRCPVCTTLDHRHAELGQLHRDTVCPMCHAHYDPQLDQEVRVTFSVHERLRPLAESANDKPFRLAIDERLGVVPGLAMLTLPDFQRLFPQERLLPDESLDVLRLALLFTDLAGSTALYAQRGDPRAYHLVRLHFDELFAAADVHGGTVVKTIGDAILAVFQSPREAVAAAVQMQHAIESLNVRRNLIGEERLILKVGLHCGPCLSVTLNERPDYFGTTVNVAARVQGLSKGNDVVFTEAVQRDPEVTPLLAGHPLQSGRFPLKGLDGETLVYRLSTEREAA